MFTFTTDHDTHTANTKKPSAEVQAILQQFDRSYADGSPMFLSDELFRLFDKLGFNSLTGNGMNTVIPENRDVLPYKHVAPILHHILTIFYPTADACAIAIFWAMLQTNGNRGTIDESVQGDTNAPPKVFSSTVAKCARHLFNDVTYVVSRGVVDCGGNDLFDSLGFQCRETHNEVLPTAFHRATAAELLDLGYWVTALIQYRTASKINPTNL